MALTNVIYAKEILYILITYFSSARKPTSYDLS